MADPVLHIKDSYYFEVPKILAPSNYDRLEEFPDVWVSLDAEYQDWHFDRLYDALSKVTDRRGHTIVNLSRDIPGGKEAVRKLWKEWQHDSHVNHGKPFDEFLEAVYAQHVAEAAKHKAEWIDLYAKHKSDVQKSGQEYKGEHSFQQVREMVLSDYLNHVQPSLMQFSDWRDDPANKLRWNQIRREANNVQLFKDDVKKGVVKIAHDPKKIDAYNYHLSGKILIPQPFATLRNLYETHPANHWYEIGISKFMVIEVVVAIIVAFAFIWLARKVRHGAAPRGKLWNLLEVFVVFIRDNVAEPAIGHHDSHRFTPYLWTIFFVVLGCNLMGMVPWMGSPTGTFGVTFAFAALTLTVSVTSSLARFGFFGFFKNLVPHMDLPIVLRIPIFVMLLVIEFAGLLIKHAVLAIRLLANMVAGHLVLLGILGVAFSVEAASQMTTAQWGIAAVISIAACTAFSLLELFVAFLQAYIITFLSALFIGSVLHEH